MNEVAGKRKQYGLIVIVFFLFAFYKTGSSMTRVAPANDHCSTAMKLSDVTNWCSSPRQFTTDAATPSGIDNPGCFPSYRLDADNDVWFRFVAVANSLNVSVIGAIHSNPKGTLVYPQMALYRGSCNGGLVEVACISDSRGDNIVETFVHSLAVGATYYIRVDARNNKTGSFQLCVNNFNPVPSPSSDCGTAVVLCDKSPFTVPSVVGAGRNIYELTPGLCLRDESSSAWYKWTCDKAGTLTFTLKPVNPSDDLDFALFWLPNGVDDCSLKMPARCMASGENVNEPYLLWARCTGATGLKASASDIVEQQGCEPDDDNFLAPLVMESGRSYALVINNYHNTGNGFSIEFGGSGTFAGPAAHFTVNKLKIASGEDLYAKDASSFSGGIKKWEWNFGVDAKPQTASGRGPHRVVYSSSGKKSISLSVETGNGCQVTKVRNVEVSDAPPPPPPPKEPVKQAVVEKKETPPKEAIEEIQPAPILGDATAYAGESFLEEKDAPPFVEDGTASEPEVEEESVTFSKYDTISRLVEYDVKFIANIYFKADSFSLEEKDFETLEEVLVILREHPEHLAIVEGHTNNIPSDEYCNKLGAARADGVIAFLENRGIETSRIYRKVLGKKRVYDKDYSLKSRRKHQRVEVKIIKRAD